MPSISLLCDDQNMLSPILNLLAADPDLTIIDEQRLNQRFLQTDMSSKVFNTPLEPLIKSWIDEEEHKNRLLLLVADSSKPLWTRFVQIYCDGSYILSKQVKKKQASTKEHNHVFNPPSSYRILNHLRRSSFDQVALPPNVDLSDTKAHQQMYRLLSGQGRGLVLSGGGARGFAHIGVLKALEEFGQEPDSLGGTSMGGLVAATYAIHRDLKIVEEITARFSSRRNILDWTLPISSLTASKKVGKMLRSILGEYQFSDLSYPLFIIACDIQGSKEIQFTEGSLYDAVRASISIPGIFYPVIRNNQTLVDGGVINNLPMDVMRQRIGSGVVFGSDLGSSTTNRDFQYYKPEGDGISGISQLLRTTFSHSNKMKTLGLSNILMKTFEVNTRKKLETTLSPRDTLISLDLSHIDPMDFGSYKRIIEEGYEQTLKQLDSMKKV
jgi:predicted acylesterase/phospholipase RssA